MKKMAMVVCLMCVSGIEGAAASTGDLVPQLCWRDDDGSEVCQDGSTTTPSNIGLDEAYEVAVSPDGLSVFTVSIGDNTLVNYDRASDGKLTYHGCWVDDTVDPDAACTHKTAGLYGARSVTVSPNSEYVYVAAAHDGAVVVFHRDPTTHNLTPIQCLQDSDHATDATCVHTPTRILEARQIAITNDARSVYVVAKDDDAISQFDVQTDGKLVYQGCVVDDDSTASGYCLQTARGLLGAHSVAISTDLTSVYVAAANDHTVQVLTRDPGTGRIFPQGCVKDDTSTETCAASRHGLRGARSVVVSPDDKSVYVAGYEDSAVVMFDRLSTGWIDGIGCWKDTGSAETCAHSADGLHGTHSLAMAQDGALYAVGRLDSAVRWFSRTPGATALSTTSTNCVTDDSGGDPGCTTTAHGLGEATSVAVYQNLSVYVAARIDDAVASFTLSP